MISLPATARFSHAVTGGLLAKLHVDAGSRSDLPDALGRPWFGCDARGFVSTASYDAMHRTTASGIALRGSAATTTASRISYGEALAPAEAQALNLLGRMLECFDQAGWTMQQGASLAGTPLAAVRYLSCDYAGSGDGMPSVAVPVLGATVPDNAGLQSQGYSGALQRIDAFGRSLESVNMQGDVLRASHLLSGMPGTISVDGVVYLAGFGYNAKAQLLSVSKGDGADCSPLFAAAFRYDPGSYRCIQRYASTASAVIASLPASGWIDGSSDAGRRQDMRFVFDPCGNVSGVQDAYPAIVFNENSVAQSDYGYDALYRLLTADGAESSSASPVAGDAGINPAVDAVAFNAGASLMPYRQCYSYDDGGNLTALSHYSDGSFSASRSVDMKVSSGSNRAITAGYYQSLCGTDSAACIDDTFFTDQGIFDACGNQLKNADLPAISWNYQNQANRVNYRDPQDSAATVAEYSVHSGDGGTRSRKVIETRNAQGLLARLDIVTFFGSAERRESYVQATASAGIDYDGETVGNAVMQCDYSELRIRLGHAQQLRILCGVLEAGEQPVTRVWYSLGDQIDSCQAELDADGSIGSYQAFYPYGGTAFGAANDTSGTGSLALKARQYSGEEKDGSGLYCYGFRSYDAANFRWTQADPAGFAGSGLNWYQMVGGNPVTYRDEMGLAGGGLHTLLSALSIVFAGLALWLEAQTAVRSAREQAAFEANTTRDWAPYENIVADLANSGIQLFSVPDTHIEPEAYEVLYHTTIAASRDLSGTLGAVPPDLWLEITFASRDRAAENEWHVQDFNRRRDSPTESLELSTRHQAWELVNSKRPYIAGHTSDELNERMLRSNFRMHTLGAEPGRFSLDTDIQRALDAPGRNVIKLGTCHFFPEQWIDYIHQGQWDKMGYSFDIPRHVILNTFMVEQRIENQRTRAITAFAPSSHMEHRTCRPERRTCEPVDAFLKTYVETKNYSILEIGLGGKGFRDRVYLMANQHNHQALRETYRKYAGNKRLKLHAEKFVRPGRFW